MEEQLITAVSYHPVLYDVGCGFYRDRTSKEEAWVKVAHDVGLSVDMCRKRWKGLWDVYMREKRREKEDGPAASQRFWRFSAVMSFLDPFIALRETTSDMSREVEEDVTAENAASSAGMPEELEEEDPSGVEHGLLVDE